MSGNYRIIDTTTWERSMHCAIFRSSLLPQYCLTVELDVSNYVTKAKDKKRPFMLAFIHAVTTCANEIEEFRYRFLDGEVVLYNQIHTSFTYLEPGEELFKVVRAEIQSNVDDYISKALEIAKKQIEYIIGPPGNDVYQFSAIPWLSYLHISHTFSGDRENAVPLFDWGRYYKKGDKMIMPFSIQAHHSFVDGLHVAKLVECLQDHLNKT